MSEQSPGYWHNPYRVVEAKPETISQPTLDAIRAIVQEEFKKALRDLKPAQTPYEAWVNWQEMED